MLTTAFVVISYLIGSLSFAVLVSKAMGLPDPHSYGSGNPGATNVLRTGSKAAALLTLAGDAGKGFVAVMLARIVGEPMGLAAGGIALCGLAAFLGHLYPVFHRFAGGKGVATAAGILLAFNGWLGLATLATWIIIAVFFRYSSLAALVASVFAPIYAFFLFGASPVVPATAVMSILLMWRHRANIKNLLAGRESRIGDKSPKPQAEPQKPQAEPQNPQA